jgi:dihydrofolate reductase
MINIIVAISDNYAIGRKGDMPWHISADLKFFKATTTGYPVVMGRKTWESIGSKPLPNRDNYIISRSMECAVGATVIKSLSEIPSDKDIFIIGGGQIYRDVMNIADRLYITHVHTTIDDADTFFPLINPLEWRQIQSSDLLTDEKSGLEFQFVTYERINNK